MPGLVGIIGPEDGRTELERMISLLRHRPDYIVSRFSDQRIFMAHVRHRHGGEPEDQDGSRGAPNDPRDLPWVEGDPDLRPEAPSLAKRIRAAADRCEATGLSDLDGGFQAAWIRSGTIVLFTDRFAHYPFYAARWAGGLAFSPEVRPLAVLPGIDRRPDLVGVRQFLEHGHPLENRTLLAGVNRLPAATTAELDRASITTRSYGGFLPPPRPVHHSSEIFDNVLPEAVADCLDRAGSRVACMLSGGMDSRCVTAEAAAQGARPTVITIGMKRSPDVRIARQVAEILGLVHHVIELPAERVAASLPEAVRVTGGAASMAHLLGHATNRAVAGLADVVLSGMCGDLIFGRQPNVMNEPPLRRAFNRLPEAQRRLVMDEGFLADTEQAYMESLLVRPSDDPDGTDISISAAVEMMRNRVSRFTLAGIVSRRLDTPVLTPFFDRRVLDAAFGLHPRLRKNQAAFIDSFTRRHPRLADVRWQYTGKAARLGLQSRSRMWRFRITAAACLASWLRIPALSPFSGYFDVAAALRANGPFRSLVEELVRGDRVRSRPWINGKGLDRLWLEHQTRKRNHTAPLMRIATIEMFLQDLS